MITCRSEQKLLRKAFLEKIDEDRKTTRLLLALFLVVELLLLLLLLLLLCLFPSILRLSLLPASSLSISLLPIGVLMMLSSVLLGLPSIATEWVGRLVLTLLFLTVF